VKVVNVSIVSDQPPFSTSNKRKPRYSVPECRRTKYPDLYCGDSYQHTTEVLEPNVSCYWATRGGWCENKYCRRHGHSVRMRVALERCKYDYRSSDTYSCTLRYDAYIGYWQFRKVLSLFLKRVQSKRHGLGRLVYWFETEWVDVVPHINFVFRVGLGSDEREVAALVRSCWKWAFVSGGVQWSGQRVGVQIVGKTRYDVRKLTKYDLKTNPGSIRLNDSRPVGWAKTSYTHPDWVTGEVLPEPEDLLTVQQHLMSVAFGCGLVVVQSPGDMCPSQQLVILCSPCVCDGIGSPGTTELRRKSKRGVNIILLMATLPRPPPDTRPQWDE
jgi:hypothetical protein